jgi:hypothetical protein
VSKASVSIHAVYFVPSSAVSSRSTTGAITLNASGSAEVLRQVNAARSSLTGINKRPLPSGAVTTHANGSLTVAGSGERVFQVRASGTIAAVTTAHERVAFNVRGHVVAVRTRAMDIYRGPHGVHTVVERRPDHTVLVSTGFGTGYLQRHFTQGGQAFIARTYVSRGAIFTRVYSPYVFHGVQLYHYVPAFYYAPDFYGWAYYGWASPAYFAWGWAGQPWYGFYGPYFAATPFYPGASLWLTDYVLGQTLADAYQMQQPAPDAAPLPDDADSQGPAPDDGSQDAEYAKADTPITPELKQAIAQDVQQQLAYENAASTQPPDQAPTLSDLPQADQANHYFVVSTPLDVTTVDSQTCNLGAGNVLRLDTPATDSMPIATLTVAASRVSDCPSGVQVTLSLDEMEEMENTFRAQLDSGLQKLHDQQGKNGLPGAPQSAIAPPPRPSGDQPGDQPDVAALLRTEQAQAAQTEVQAYRVAKDPF